MKKITFFLLFAILLSSCNENEYIDPTVMPEKTTSGNNTFGCLVDGWIYTGGRYLDWGSSIHFRYYRENNFFTVSVKVRNNNYIYLTINNPVENQTCTFTDALFDNDTLGSGEVKITRFDKEQRILSGTFSGSRITHGRFDVVYNI
jgi:hypothetical protein